LIPFLTALPIWGKLSQPIRQIIIWAALIGLAFWALRIWTNRIWDKGFVEGRSAGIIDLEKAKKAEWENQQKKIADERMSVEEQRKTIQLESQELARSRQAITKKLDDALKQISIEKGTTSDLVCQIPTDQLDASIRAISAELAAAVK
jgi:hypothetical protein